ncbi:MAG: GTPase domain-containing protein [Desulfuromonadaceae bacterium]|nr:GTPase domain-containing protein [Desulfuromonadaceae bacterium]MDD2849648.1 GTPase domain-containing protein [Desulfuromonadaceae bacterium]MDD4131680.1 GTPase domain-containing protein [Desulfuromonadaceae bacterium]
MALPIILWIVAGVVSMLGGTALSVYWNDIIVALKGKRIAVLGARGVGKTHLIKFLTSGSIPSEYKQTLAPEKAAAKRLQLKDLDLKIKDTLDLSGDKAAYAEWKELHNKSDLVFYLLRADGLMAGDVAVESRVREDLRHIGGWLKGLKDKSAARPRFFIIGTHCDLDNEFAAFADRLGDYADKFQTLPIVSELVAHGGGSKETKVILGSMKTVQDTEALVYKIFMQVKP